MGEPVPENFNPADHFISSLAPNDLDEKRASEKIQGVCDHFDKSEVARDLRETIRQGPRNDSSSITSPAMSISIQRRHKHRATWFQQFAALTKRSFLVTVRI